MALYSMIQLVTILILYWRISSLADNMWLWHDMAIVQLIAIVFGFVEPYRKLSASSPPRRLFTLTTIVSLSVHILTCVGFQVAVYFFTGINYYAYYNNNCSIITIFQ